MKARLQTAIRLAAISLALGSLPLIAAAPLISRTPSTRADQPRITFQFPQEGDVLAEPPKVLQMCFEKPVNIRDLDKGGDFRFGLFRPDRLGLGMRIVFQPDGYGVAIYPGLGPEGIIEGEWRWEYRLTDAQTLDAIEGSVKFSVSAANGEPVLQPTPPACLAPGSTPAPTLIQVPSGSASAGRSPGLPSSSRSPGASPGSDGGAPDVLLLSLLTIGAAAGAAFVGLIGYLFRRKIGFWPHRPPPDGGAGSDRH